MAQRRSLNRRRTKGRRSSNVSEGILDDDTNVIPTKDPQWFNLTSVRPSTSISFSVRESTFLNPGSTMNDSQQEENWYNNLSSSVNSRLINEATEKNEDLDSTKEEFINVDDVSESASDEGAKKKRRARIRTRLNLNKDQSERTNVFSRALEKTTDASVKVSSITTHNNESESNQDESRTIKKQRSKFLSRKKKFKDNSKNNFDKFFQSPNLSENINKSPKNSKVLEDKMNSSQRNLVMEKNINITDVRNSKEKDVNVDDISECTSNDTVAITKLRSKAFRTQKSKNVSNHFDLAFDSDQSSEVPQNQSNTVRSPMKRKSIDENINSPASKRSKNQNEKTLTILLERIENLDESLNYSKSSRNSKTNEKESFSEISSIRALKNKIINESAEKSQVCESAANISNNEIPVHLTNTQKSDQTSTEVLKSHVRNKSANLSKKQNKSSELSVEKLRLLESKENTNNFNDAPFLHSPVKQKNLEIQTNQITAEKHSLLSPLKSSKQNNKSTSNKMINESSKKSHPGNESESFDEELISEEQIDSEYTSNKMINKSNEKAHTENKSESSEELISEEQIDSRLQYSNVTTRNKSRLTATPDKSKTQEKSKFEKKINKSKEKIANIDSEINKNKSFRKSPGESANDSQNKLSSSSRDTRKNSSIHNSGNLVQNGTGASTTHNGNNFVEEAPANKSSAVNNDKSIEGILKNQIAEKTTKLSSSKNQTINKSLNSTEVHDQIKNKNLNLFSKNKKNITSNLMDDDLESDRATSASSEAFSDDLLQTPHPAQSTLVPSGKPLSRLTIFQNSRQSLFDRVQDTPPASSHGSSIRERTGTVQVPRKIISQVQETVHKKLESRTPEGQKILPASVEIDRPNLDDSRTSFKSAMSRSTRGTWRNEFVTDISDSKWEEVQKKIDEKTKNIEEQEKRDKQMKLVEERKRKKTQAELWRSILQRKSVIQQKSQPKKVIDKAFLVNGKPYKQPKLPHPQSWVTDRLYNFLWKYMEPKYKIRTRIESEEFVRRFSDLVKIIIKRKKYENYEPELDEILNMMARYRLIENRNDFYAFCRDFMPYNFRVKVVPMLKPGNVRNIPYKPELLFKPILRNTESDYSEEETDENQARNDNNEPDSESE